MGRRKEAKEKEVEIRFRLAVSLRDWIRERAVAEGRTFPKQFAQIIMRARAAEADKSDQGTLAVESFPAREVETGKR
jgi:hypothetical protein